MADEGQQQEQKPSGDDAMKTLQFERDSARADLAKVNKQIEELKKTLPSEDQRKKWDEALKAQEHAEEERKKKAGEWDSLRQQLVDKHAKELDTALSGKSAAEKELNDTLIGLAFAGATDLFGPGPTAKTVLLPEMAQAYFGAHVEVRIDDKTGKRQVIVKDGLGHPLLDPKTGQPMEFAKAMKEIVESHPQKDHLLRGSGKVGSGSTGGVNDTGGKFDPNKMTVADFRDPAKRDALRRQQAEAGGLSFGPAWDRVAASKK